MSNLISVLLVADQDDEGNIQSNFSRLLGAALKLKACGNIECSIDVVVFKSVSPRSLDRLSSFPISNVLCVALENPSAETICENLQDLVLVYTHVLTVSSTSSKDWLPRLGGVLSIQPITDIISVHTPQEYSRYIYAGNLIERIGTNQSLQLLSIRANLFESATSQAHNKIISVKNTESKVSILGSYFVARTLSNLSRPELSSATKVVSGGRGLRSKENFQLIEQVADLLGAAVGASRAAVDAGFVTNDYQVGQTGKSVAPDLYLAIGISGAVQHLAGMKDSRVIAAINLDPEAPIFQVADVGLVGDLFDVLPQLITLLKK